jgi:hypothetical protein
LVQIVVLSLPVSSRCYTDHVVQQVAKEEEWLIVLLAMRNEALDGTVGKLKLVEGYVLDGNVFFVYFPNYLLPYLSCLFVKSENKALSWSSFLPFNPLDQLAVMLKTAH